MSFTIGKKIGPYEIRSTLGAGGMGVVYEAIDTRLGRHVAIKVLPEEVSLDDNLRQRFEREARTISRLNHPNICTLHDIGEHDGRPFIVMEVVQGDTLQKRLAAGPLDASQSIDHGIQLADALDAAHSEGVIHRDIKPANIVITDRGQAKLLDFGLAKLTPHAEARAGTDDPSAPTIDDAQLTQPRTAVGTVAYMSPEQARGEELDVRTDLFSLGAVLHEMVTGQRAFPGQTTAVIFDAILNRAPTPPAHFAPDVPMRLGEIISNATEKNRDLRYQTAADLRADLRRARRDLDSGRSVSLGASAFVGVQIPPSGATSQTAAGVPATPLVSGQPGSGQTPEPSARGRVWLYGGFGLVVAALVTLLFLPPKPTTDVPQADPITALARAQLAQATQSLAGRDYESAIAQADAALALQPDDVETQRVRSAAVAALESQTSPTPTPETERTAGPDPPPTQSTSPVAPAPQEPAVPEPQPRPAAPAQTTTPPPATAPPSTPEPVDLTTVPLEPEPVPEPEPTAIVTPEPAPPPPDDPPVTQPTVARDETAIRRVLDDFVRATETKDVELYRSVRPLSADEERRLRAGFDAVDTQQVELLIQSIEITGDQASVQVSRQDTFGANGREQTQRTSLAFTLTRQDGGWVITEITNR